MSGNTLLTRKEAAIYLATIDCPVAPSTLQSMAAQGKGPRYIRHLQRIVRYRVDDLKVWAAKVRSEGGEGVD